MKFRTEIDVSPCECKISHSHKGITIGSCFTDYIGNKLAAFKFPVFVNPLGTVYNPVSISQSIDIIRSEYKLQEYDVFFDKGVWQSFMLHSSFSSIHKNQVIETCSQVQQSYHDSFAPLDYCIISLGTAWVYELVSTGQIVSNCHKVPAMQFSRKRLSVAQCVDALAQQIIKLQSENPRIAIIFTVSPIRHWKDGAYENQISKSTLFLAIDELRAMFPTCYYFPAYELLIDDLRDYRFYESDMLHPSVQAIEYIWQKFSQTFFDTATQNIVIDIERIIKAVHHKPYHPQSAEYMQFIQKNYSVCQALQTALPKLDFSQELSFFSSQQ